MNKKIVAGLVLWMQDHCLAAPISMPCSLAMGRFSIKVHWPTRHQSTCIDKVKEVWYRLDVILKFGLTCISNNDMVMATDKQGNSLRSSSLLMCSRTWEDLEEDVYKLAASRQHAVSIARHYPA